MLRNIKKYQFARLLLISLMAFSLIGIQVLQVSPLHQHAEHSVDCALCHLQLSDDAEIQHQHVITRIARAVIKTATASPFYSSLSPSPYQGRAPPL
jgi:hypothetical protein